MARSFVSATPDFLRVNATPVTGPPLTVSAWVRVNAAPTSVPCFFSIVDKDTNVEWFALQINADGDARLFLRSTAEGQHTLDTNTNNGVLRQNEWGHVCGVIRSSSDRQIYLNYRNTVTQTTTVVPANMDRMAIGRLDDSTASNPWFGDIAEVGVWNAALLDSDVLSLSRRVPPDKINSGKNLVGYWPLIDPGDFARDESGVHNHMADLGSTKPSRHPKLITKHPGGVAAIPPYRPVAAVIGNERYRSGLET